MLRTHRVLEAPLRKLAPAVYRKVVVRFSARRHDAPDRGRIQNSSLSPAEADDYFACTCACFAENGAVIRSCTGVSGLAYRNPAAERWPRNGSAGGADWLPARAPVCTKERT